MIKFSTDRLYMMPLTTKYFASTHAYASDPENTRYMIFMPRLTPEDTLKYLRMAEREWKKAEPRCFEFAVFLRRIKEADENDTHIGSLSVFVNENRTGGEVGWILSKKYWGKGYGAEAASALINWCRDVAGLSRLTAHCDRDNLPSRRIMEKLGFTLIDTEGRRKNRGSETESCEYTYMLELIASPDPQSGH